MGRKLVVLGGFFMFLLGTGNLEAQVRIGPQASYGNDADFGIGARAMIDFPTMLPGLGLIGSFDYFFPSAVDLSGFGVDISTNYWEINANLFYSFPVNTPGFEPYVGGGLNFANASVDLTGTPVELDDTQSEIGFNLLFGFLFPVTGLSPFVEVRIELGGDEDFLIRGDNQVVVTGGLLFP